MPIVEQSRTDRFILQYDDQIAPAQQVAQALSQTIEQDFFFLRRYLPFDQSNSPDDFMRHPTTVVFVDTTSQTALGLTAVQATQIPGRGGGRNFGNVTNRGGTIWLNVFGASNNPVTPTYARFLFIAEMSEQLMGFFGWAPASSRGEALSRALAEQFFPAAAYASECISIAPWVNGWLNTSPRPDYIHTNPAPTVANANLGTDLDGLGYGCGMLFINYLRYQLGFPFEAICQAGGVTFADAYKNLGFIDDPLANMNALLIKHFSTSTINLLDNNPFPLYDSAARRVILGFASSIANVPVHQRSILRTAHLSPFINCPVKAYRYRHVNQAVTCTITAEAIGFALPQFQWFINGVELFISEDTHDFALEFDVPDPDNPRVPKPLSGTARFHWKFSNGASRGQLPAGVLTITNDSLDGVYQMDLEVRVTETFDADGTVSAKASLEFEALKIVYETQFYTDLKACEKRFVAAVPSLQQTVDLVLGRPDPAKGRTLRDTITAVDSMRAVIARIDESDPHLAMQAAQYAAAKLEIEPHLLGARKLASD
jgi:hypothetical protein